MYRKKTSSFIKHFDFMLLDMVCLEMAFMTAYIIRHGIKSNEVELPIMYRNIVVFLLLVSVVVGLISNEYKSIVRRGHYREVICVVQHATIIMGFLVTYLFMTKQGEGYSRKVFIYTWILDVVFSYIVREIWKWVVNKSLIKSVYNGKSIIVITTYHEVKNVVDNLTKGNVRYNIKGICITDRVMTGEEVEGIEVVADKDGILRYLCRQWVDEVFISLGNDSEKLEQEIAEDCVLMGITVHQVLGTISSKSGEVHMIEKMNDYTVLSSAIKTVTIQEMFVKRAMDIIGSIIGLIITGILFIFIAPAIYIKSPGPIFFKQWRVGKNGKKFQIYKFRSMYMDAEDRKAELMKQNKVKDGMMFKMDNDPRIIGGENGKGIGNFIRNTSIDEFPQFFNVLKGDMSLVGTRPPTLDEWEKYELHHRARLAIKPGLTGMWQVSGRSNITDFEEVVKLDTEYIMNWSIGKDIKIILKTIWVVLTGKGSM